ncbi:hypothetical protein [Azotobacter chroococcum]|uniref:hypothetical protein n=1 Tax=Azotobacter chroococcum TaxID=353 RepID=UPI0011871885|nr:hypothetical protein [Azotobacter chroococcum]
MINQSEMNAVMRIILKKYHPERYKALLNEEAAEQQAEKEESIRLLKLKYEQEVREEIRMEKEQKKEIEKMSLPELVDHLHQPSLLSKSKRQWIELSTKRTL